MPTDDLVVSFEERSGDRGWPRVEDLKSRHSRVYVDHDLVAVVRDVLLKNRICVIRGAEGRGKTVLARTVAFQLKSEYPTVRLIHFA